jgi:hypothetical protein
MLPESVMHSAPFAILATFVALNTMMYASLAVAKLLPKVYLSDALHRRVRRDDDRSIDAALPPLPQREAVPARTPDAGTERQVHDAA